MGRLARGDPMAGWRAWERQTVLGRIDGEGWRDNPHNNSARMRIILKIAQLLLGRSLIYVTLQRFWSIVCEDGREQ